jgi:hypothetical protein
MNNPLAFPKAGLDHWNKSTPINEGMTLRDYFAAKSLPTLMSFYEDMDGIAGAAYKMADAMLKARETNG